MADDRGTDYVNEQIKKRELSCIGPLELAESAIETLSRALDGCGFDAAGKAHLKGKLLDIDSWVHCRLMAIRKSYPRG